MVHTMALQITSQRSVTRILLCPSCSQLSEVLIQMEKTSLWGSRYWLADDCHLCPHWLVDEEHYDSSYIQDSFLITHHIVPLFLTPSILFPFPRQFSPTSDSSSFLPTAPKCYYFPQLRRLDLLSMEPKASYYVLSFHAIIFNGYEVQSQNC